LARQHLEEASTASQAASHESQRNHSDWRPGHSFDGDLEANVRWTLDQLDWCAAVRERTSYRHELIGTIKPSDYKHSAKRKTLKP
jgi:hypothetical protein